MILNHKELGGEGSPILISHGLFGSMKNWISNGKELTKSGRVFLLDLRNHGDSFHSDSHTIQDLSLDLKNFISHYNLEKPILLGHSMGGLASMLFSLLSPELAQAIIIVDIAPRNYPLSYKEEFSALSMDVSRFKTRQELDLEMKKVLPDTFIRQFLQMSLEREKEGGYRWKLNVEALKNARDGLSLNINKDSLFQKKSLFILGKDSPYIKQPEDIDKILEYFPFADIQFIDGAGHYLHYTHSSEFLRLVENFLKSI